MARIKKRHTSGSAKNYITRTQAVRKLQVDLADFRRLCIFKGIYPRVPKNKKKANKGSLAPATFYYAKDIQYLLHEPVLARFRDHKAFAKKLNKALSKGELRDAQRLAANRPKYSLENIIKERYPTFLDALRDLDDPLNMLFLFANMPATDSVSHRVTKEAERLTNQWMAYVAKARLVTKVFVSIKGVYYQATIKGQEVRWLVPFKFPTNIPTDVDFRIMLTFLELYSTLLHFVLFRLYADANLIYPPTIDIAKLRGVGGLLAYVLQAQDGANALVPQEKAAEPENVAVETHLSKEELSKAMEADEAGEDENDDAGENVEEVELDQFEDSSKTKGDVLAQPAKYASSTATLFSNFVFYVGREVLLDILEFCILSGGGSVISEIALDDLKLNHPDLFAKLDLSHITHQVVDRPKVAGRVAGRTYLQPQWVFDSINKGELVSVNAYAPGETLPPHLSPWGDAGGYNPEAELAEANEDEDEEVVEGEGEDEEEDEDIRDQKELELEAAGVKFSENTEVSKTKKAPKRPAEDEEKELKKIMMTNKQRKLYEKMQHGINKQETRQEELAKKRRKVEKTKAQLNKLDSK